MIDDRTATIPRNQYRDLLWILMSNDRATWELLGAMLSGGAAADEAERDLRRLWECAGVERSWL